MQRVKNAALVFCLFVVLLVTFSTFHASGAGAFFGALAGTPLLVHVFNRLAPSRRTADPDRTITAIVAPRHSPPTEVVLRVENGRG